MLPQLRGGSWESPDPTAGVSGTVVMEPPRLALGPDPSGRDGPGHHHGWGCGGPATSSRVLTPTRAGVHSCYRRPLWPGLPAAGGLLLGTGHGAPDSHRPPSREPQSLLARPQRRPRFMPWAARAGRHRLSWLLTWPHGETDLRPCPPTAGSPTPPRAPAEPPTRAAWPPGGPHMSSRAGRAGRTSGSVGRVPTWLAPPAAPRGRSPSANPRGSGSRGAGRTGVEQRDAETGCPLGCRGSHRTEGGLSLRVSQPLRSLHLWGPAGSPLLPGEMPSQRP